MEKEIRDLIEECKEYSKLADDAEREYQAIYDALYREKHKAVAKRIHEIEEYVDVCLEELPDICILPEAKYGAGPFAEHKIYIRFENAKAKAAFMYGNEPQKGDVDNCESLSVRTLVNRWKIDEIEEKLLRSIKTQLEAEIQKRKRVPQFWRDEIDRIKNA